VLQAGIEQAFGLGSSLSGATPGEREGLVFQRVSGAARLRRNAHARSDSLGHSAALHMTPLLLAKVLAASFLAGEATVEEIVSRGSRALGRRWGWVRPLAKRYVQASSGRTRLRHREVVRFFLQDRGFRNACSRYSGELSVKQWMAEPMQMRPVGAASTWDVPVIATTGDLAARLGLEIGELEWFADLKGLGYKKNVSSMRHYHYRILAKESGNIRLIEAPKARLKELQRRILREILEKIPAHPAVHGFLRGKSVKSFVVPHVNRHVVLRMDLQDFFPSIGAVRVQAFFRTLGYPEDVADRLGGICTNAAPHDLWKDLDLRVDRRYLREVRDLYSRPHVPQGAPTSPALANLCFFRTDCRLAGLAKSVGAAYTRYADDLAFSGDKAFERRAERFSLHVAAIMMEEGFRANHRKTRVMRQSVRQQLAGLVANQKPNVRRSDFDNLKATLTNCARLGPVSQNHDHHPYFQAHLKGRVGFVEAINPVKGRRLRAIYDRIRWE
jgi:RNA-directed DNA polymerase